MITEVGNGKQTESILAHDPPKGPRPEPCPQNIPHQFQPGHFFALLCFHLGPLTDTRKPNRSLLHRQAALFPQLLQLLRCNPINSFSDGSHSNPFTFFVLLTVVRIFASFLWHHMASYSINLPILVPWFKLLPIRASSLQPLMAIADN